MAEFVTVAKTGDVPEGEGRVVEAGGKEIALFNVDGSFHAIDNICVHRGGPLGEGALEGTTVACPWHAWTYDVTSGKCIVNPEVCLEKYEVKVENEEIQIAV
jgi:nitrite reductase (NADH) small subunit